MFNKIMYCLVFIAIAGCDKNLTSNHSFKWAVINQNILQNKVSEIFKKTDAFYKENSGYEGNRRELNLIEQQIGEITLSAAQKCAADIGKLDKNNPATPSKTIPKEPSKIMPTQMAGAPSRQAGWLYGDEFQYGQQAGGSELMQNPAYQDCLRNIRTDQLLIDLKDKKKKIDSLSIVLQQHEQDSRKQINEEIELAVAKYAKQNGYQVILNGANNIMYNRDNVVLDVTNDALEYIKNNHPEVKVNNPATVKE